MEQHYGHDPTCSAYSSTMKISSISSPTATSKTLTTFGCLKLFSMLISRNAVMGTFSYRVSLVLAASDAALYTHFPRLSQNQRCGLSSEPQSSRLACLGHGRLRHRLRVMSENFLLGSADSTYCLRRAGSGTRTSLVVCKLPSWRLPLFHTLHE